MKRIKKIKKNISLFIAYIFIVTTIIQVLPINAKAEEKLVTTKPLKAIEGQVVFKLADLKYTGFEETLKKFQGIVLSKNGPYLVAKVDNQKVKDLIGELEKDTNIVFAESNATGKKQGNVVNDPSIGEQEYLFRAHAMEAWDLIKDTTTEVKIAVVDSGVSTDHPDLQNKLLGGYNFVSNNTNINDDNGHGTQVAGIIAANSNNGIGISGVAGKVNAKLIPIKVVDAFGNCTSANVAAGILRAVELGAQIINLSISGDGYSKVVEDAIKTALIRNALVVTASGDNYDNAENYWPANVEGSVVVSNIPTEEDYYGNFTPSNFGKNITLAALGRGVTTDIGKGYTFVKGSSYSAAVVSAIAAMAKIKNTQYTRDQIQNLLKKSTNLEEYKAYNHYTGYGVIDALKLWNATNDFIEITSPKSGESLTGNVQLKVKAIFPDKLIKLEVYLNDENTKIDTITSNNGSEYSYSINSILFKEGINKIIVKAYSTDTTTPYVDYRYIKRYNTSKNQISLNVIGLDGTTKVPKGTKVYLYKENDKTYQWATALINENGIATFYNTDPNVDYSALIIYDNGSSTQKKPVFFQTAVKGAGTFNFNAKTAGVRPVTITAKKADNTALTNSKFYACFGWNRIEFSNMFDANGTATIYVMDSLRLPIKLVNDEGYIYEKIQESFNEVNTLNFTVDSSLAKVTINNEYTSNLTKELLGIAPYEADEFYFQSNFDMKKVKDKTLYVPKSTYAYSYETFAKDTSGKEWSYGYNHLDIDVISDMTKTYGKLNLSINKSSNSYNGSVFAFYSDILDTDDNLMYDQSFDIKDNVKLYNSSGQLVDASQYTIYQQYRTFYVVIKGALPSGAYTVNTSANLGPLGKVDSNSLSFDYTNPNIPITEYNFIVKPPFTTTDKLNVKLQVFGKDSDYPSFSTESEFNGTSDIAFKLNKDYVKAGNTIVIFGETESGLKFYYNRVLGDVSSQNITIDNTQGTARRLTVKLDDAAKKYLISNSKINIDTKLYDDIEILGKDIDATGLTKMWLEDGSYPVTFINFADKYILGGSYSIGPASADISLSTKNLAKFNVKVSNVYGYLNSRVKVSGFEVDVKDNDIIYVAPELEFSVNQISVCSYDEAEGRQYTYNYRCNYDLTANTVYNIELKDLTLVLDDYEQNISLPRQISVNYSLKAGDLILNNIEAVNYYEHSNELPKEGYDKWNWNTVYANLYNSSGNIISSTLRDNGYAYFDRITLTDNTLKSGSYYFKLVLPDNIKVFNNVNIPINISTDNLQKIRVMDPFEISRGSADATVMIGYNSYHTDSNGYIYVSKTDISNSTPVSVSCDFNNGFVFYTANIQASASDIVFNKSISDLKKVVVKQKSTNGKVNLANRSMKLKDSNNKYYYMDLDYNGQKVLYVEPKIYTIESDRDYDDRVNERYFLKASFDASAQSEAIFDNESLALIKSNNPISINFGGSYGYGSFSGEFYASDNLNCSYSYSKALNSTEYRYMDYNGSLITKANTIQNIYFGSKITVNQNLDKNEFVPGDYINGRLSFNDEYNNQVTLRGNIKIKAIISQNGTDISSTDLTVYSYGSPYVSFAVPGGVSGNVKLRFEVDLDSLGKAVSANTDIKVDTSSYYKVTVKDPSGAVAKGGTIILRGESEYYDAANVNFGDTGVAFIKKDSITINKKYKATIAGYTKADNDLFVYVKDYVITDVNSSDKIFAPDNNMTKANISTIKPENKVISDYGFVIYKNGYSIARKNLGNSNILKDLNYENFNIWLENGVYSFNLDLVTEDEELYLIRNTDIDIAKTKDIVMNGKNLSHIVPVYEGEGKVTYIDLHEYGMHEIYGHASNYEIYASKKNYEKLYLNVKNNDGSYFTILKDNITIKDDATELHFGDGEVIVPNPFEADYNLWSGGVAYTKHINLAKDKNGFYTYLSNDILKVSFYKLDGTLVKVVDMNNYEYLNLPDLEEGLYNVSVSGTVKGLGELKTNPVTVSVLAVEGYEFAINNFQYGSISLYDGSTKIADFSSSGSNFVQISKKLLTVGKSYSLHFNYIDYSNVINSFKTDIIIGDNRNYWVDKPSDLIQTTINLSTNLNTKVIFNNLTLNAEAGKNGQISAMLQPGSYSLNINGLDNSSNKYYLIDRSFNVDVNNKDFNVDFNSLNSLSLGELFGKKPYEVAYTFKKQGTSNENIVNYLEVPAGNTVYVDKGIYEIDASLFFNNLANPIQGKYTVDCSGSSASLVLGKNLKAKVDLNSTSFNVGSAMSLSKLALYDGNVTLSSLSLAGISIASFDLMHGDKVIKNFTGNIDSKLYGETNIRLNLVSDIIGNIVTEIKTITVNNPTFIAFGDINLDSIVDVYDLVFISKDIGKKRGIATDWDGRCNLDNLDNANVIDIKDLAKAAKNYNKRF